MGTPAPPPRRAIDKSAQRRLQPAPPPPPPPARQKSCRRAPPPPARGPAPSPPRVAPPSASSSPLPSAISAARLAEHHLQPPRPSAVSASLPRARLQARWPVPPSASSSPPSGGCDSTGVSLPAPAGSGDGGCAHRAVGPGGEAAAIKFIAARPPPSPPPPPAALDAAATPAVVVTRETRCPGALGNRAGTGAALGMVCHHRPAHRHHPGPGPPRSSLAGNRRSAVPPMGRPVVAVCSVLTVGAGWALPISRGRDCITDGRFCPPSW